MPTSPADLGPRPSSPYEDRCDMHGVVTKSSPWSVKEAVSPAALTGVETVTDAVLNRT